jgi:hypothetical protein
METVLLPAGGSHRQFNTTTSMGRLTLNVLLSFAQFEREIIGERDQLARNATSRGRLGRRLLGRSWRRFANGDRRGRDGAAHSRHLKPGSARLLAEGAVSVWRFGSGSGDGVRMPAVALPPLRPAHHEIDIPTAAL